MRKSSKFISANQQFSQNVYLFLPFIPPRLAENHLTFCRIFPTIQGKTVPLHEFCPIANFNRKIYLTTEQLLTDN